MKKNNCSILCHNKLGRKIITIAVSVSVLLGSFASPEIVNAAEDSTKIIEYYHKAEVSSQETAIDNLTGLYGGILNTYQNQIKNGAGQTVSVKGTFSEKFADSIDLSGVNNIEIKIDSMVKDMSGRAFYKFFVNEEKLFTSEAYFDGEKGQGNVRFPELSKAYLSTSLENIYGSSSIFIPAQMQNIFMNNPFTEQMVNHLLKKYLKIITDQLNNVTLKEDVEVSANGVTSKFDELEVTIKVADVYNISKAVLTAAYEDETLAFLCEKAGICTQTQFRSSVRTMLDDLRELQKSELGIDEYSDLYGKDWDTIFVMKVWVDSTGQIVGRKMMQSEDDEDSFGYLTVVDGAKTGFEAWMSDEDGDYFRIKAEGITDASSVFSGKAVISGDEFYKEEPDKFTIDMKNVNFKYLSEGYIDGTFIFTSSLSKNDSIKLTCLGSPNSQNIKYDILKNGVSEVLVEIDAKDVFYSGISFPSDAEEIFDLNTEMESYMESGDLEGFIERIDNQLKDTQLGPKWKQWFKGVINEESTN